MDEADSAPETCPAPEKQTMPMEPTPPGAGGGSPGGDSAFRRTEDLDPLTQRLFPQFTSGETGLQTEDPEWIGDYRIVGRLGRGGMGVVYAAVDTTLDRPVALKVMLPQLTADRDFAARFVREAKAAARVHHPNIVTVYAAGEIDGRLYMALEYVEGGTLAAAIHQDHGMSEDRVLPILVQSAEGLQAIHRAGLMHRDIKPENIFLTADGRVKIGDLGLARSAQGEDRMTATGIGMGTPAYMAPEQAEGLADLDIRADIYALGATLFTMLTGRRPFEGATPWEVVSKVLNDRVPRARQFRQSVSRATDDLCNKAMAKDRTKRHQSPDELVEHARTVSTAMVTDDGRILHRRRFAFLGPQPALAVLAFTALVAVGFGIGIWRQQVPPTATTSSTGDGTATVANRLADRGPLPDTRPVVEPSMTSPTTEPPSVKPPPTEPLPITKPPMPPVAVKDPPPVIPPAVKDPPPVIPPAVMEPPLMERIIEHLPGKDPAGPPVFPVFDLQLPGLVDAPVAMVLVDQGRRAQILWCREDADHLDLLLTTVTCADGRRQGEDRVVVDGEVHGRFTTDTIRADLAGGIVIVAIADTWQQCRLPVGRLTSLQVTGTVAAVDGVGDQAFLVRSGAAGWEAVAVALATGRDIWKTSLPEGEWSWLVAAGYDVVSNNLLLAHANGWVVLRGPTVVMEQAVQIGPIKASALAGGTVLVWEHDRRDYVSLLRRIGLGTPAVDEAVMRLTGSGRNLAVTGGPGSPLAVAGGRGHWLIDTATGKPVAAVPVWTRAVADGAVYGWDADTDILYCRPQARMTAEHPEAVSPALLAATRRTWRNEDTGLTIGFLADGSITLADRSGVTPSSHPWTWATWSTNGDVLLLDGIKDDIAWFVLAEDGMELRLNDEQSGTGRFVRVDE